MYHIKPSTDRCAISTNQILLVTTRDPFLTSVKLLVPSLVLGPTQPPPPPTFIRAPWCLKVLVDLLYSPHFSHQINRRKKICSSSHGRRRRRRQSDDGIISKQRYHHLLLLTLQISIPKTSHSNPFFLYPQQQQIITLQKEILQLQSSLQALYSN